MIILIDNYDSFTYNLYQQILHFTDQCIVLRNDQFTISDLEALAPNAIIISPGPGRPEQAGLAVEVIKHFAQTTPILGVCLGHQALAYAFGGQITHAKQIKHGKTSRITHQHQGLFKNMPQQFDVGRYHSLQVSTVDVPADFVVDATAEDGTVMAIRHKTLPLFGLQFHPESVLTPLGDQLMQYFIQHFVKGKSHASRD